MSLGIICKLSDIFKTELLEIHTSSYTNKCTTISDKAFDAARYFS